MKRSQEAQRNRSEIIKTALNSPEKAAEAIKKLADKIGNSQGTSEIVANLSTLLCVSESTIYSELKK